MALPKQQESREAAAAAKILGVDVKNPNGRWLFFKMMKHQRRIITAIRKYQPEIILCNAPSDHHPDHGRSAKLVADAAFLSRLQKL